jgi:signal transduction histidine kinase/ActR/RegA family two-component response regulator
MPSYLAFVFPTTLPVSLRTFLEGGDIYQVLGLCYLLFLGVGIFFSNNLNRMVTRSIQLRFENLELLEDLKEQKDRAEKSRQTAEQAVLAKDRFLASASHDLRQPLHALGLFYGALKQYVSGREGLHLLDKIDQSIGALNHIFNSLLDVSRLDAGVVGVQKRHFELAPLLGTIHSEYHQAADNKGVRLECSACDAVAFTDPVLLERILRNLVSNAISYTQTGDVEFGCAVQQDGSIRIEVRDTGIGIPVEEQENIFSEYHQIDNPERDRSKGLGLGLAIVRRLTRLLDVRMSVQSEPGKGSLFSVIVPPGDPAQVVEYDSKGTLQDVSGTVVLVIDDDSDIRDGMQRLLSEWGCTPVLAGSAEEAIAQLVDLDIVPDVIFVDYRLRENRTGIDALQAVSEELNADLPAVIITGDTSRDRLQEATEHGLALLHKPVSPAEVRVAIHQALARR